VNVNYERLPIRCGKARCRCNTGDQRQWHGPYWYAFWNDPITGRKRSAYVGKRFVPPRKARGPVHSEWRRAPEPGEQQAPPPRSPPASSSQDARDAELLGVSTHATADEVRRAWRKLAAANHPDRFPANKRHHQEEIAKQINAAYDRFRRRRGWS
jgi:hypothetical protein